MASKQRMKPLRHQHREEHSRYWSKIYLFKVICDTRSVIPHQPRFPPLPERVWFFCHNSSVWDRRRRKIVLHLAVVKCLLTAISSMPVLLRFPLYSVVFLCFFSLYLVLGWRVVGRVSLLIFKHICFKPAMF